MGIVRNFIDIIGITAEDELPTEGKGQMMAFSEVDNIFVPEEKKDIDTIYQIIVDLEIKSTRSIKSPLGKIQVIDGVKKFKIIYSGAEASGQINILNLSVPFNTFIDLPDDVEVGNIKLYILDAYFQLIDRKKIYGHFLYMMDVHYNNPMKNDYRKDIHIPNINKVNEIEKDLIIEFFDRDEVSLSKEEGRHKMQGEFEPSYLEKGKIVDIDSEYL